MAAPDEALQSPIPKGRSRSIIIPEKDQETIRKFLMENDFLYNKNRDLWRDTPAREQKWYELSELMHRDPRDIKQWYESTRHKLSDIKNNKLKHSVDGFEVEGVTDKARRLWNRFQFLMPHIGGVKTRNQRNLKRKRPSPSHVDKTGLHHQTPTLKAPGDIPRPTGMFTANGQDFPVTPGGTSSPSTNWCPDITSLSAGLPSTNTLTHNDEGIQALVESNRKLIKVADNLVKNLQSERTCQQQPQRQHFTDMCGAILQQLPTDLYMDASDRIWTVLQEAQRAVQGRRESSVPQSVIGETSEENESLHDSQIEFKIEHDCEG